MSKAIQYLLDRFSRSFSANGRYLCEFSRSGPVFLIPQGMLPWQPILLQNCGKITYTTALIALSFRNRMGYRLVNMCIYNSANRSTSYETMVKISSVVFVLKWGRKWKLCCDLAKIGVYHQISQQLLSSLYQRFSVGRCIYANYKTDIISFTVVQGTLLWYPINFGQFLPMSKWPSSLFTLVFWNKMHYRLADARVNSFPNCSRPCEKWWKLVH